MEEDEHLRTLEYFNQPFEPGNGIKILDDLELKECLSLESLGTNFGPAEPRQISAVDREEFENEVGSVDDALKESRGELNTSVTIAPPPPQVVEDTPHEKNKKKSKGKVDELGDLDMFGYNLLEDPSELD